MAAAVVGSLASALLEGVSLPDKFGSALTAVLPGATCLRCETPSHPGQRCTAGCHQHGATVVQ